MKHLINKLSAFLVMLMCVPAMGWALSSTGMVAKTNIAQGESDNLTYDTEIQALADEANAIIESNDGTTIGMPAKAVVDALSAAVTTAQNSRKTLDDLNTLRAAIDAYFATTNVYLPTGYYRMHNFNQEADKRQTLYYAYNDYEREYNNQSDRHFTLMSTTPVNTNNGIWYIQNNCNGTIIIKNGEGTPMRMDYTTVETLTFGGYNKEVYSTCPGGIYFTEGIHGSATKDSHVLYGDPDKTSYLTKWTSFHNVSSYWKFEPLEESYNVASIFINGDEGNGYVTYNGQKAKDGGFFIYNGNPGHDEFEVTDIADKYKAITSFCLSTEPRTIIADYVVNDEATRAKLQALVDKINASYGIKMESKIGYSESKDQPISIALTRLYGYQTGGLNKQHFERDFEKIWTSANTIASWPKVVLPKNENFYTFTDNNGNKKTYYITENNELLCYENGQFAKVDGFSEVGTEIGEAKAFNFVVARTDEPGKPTELGKLCVMQEDEAVLPSGDGHSYSGWTIEKTNPTVKMNEIGGYYYASMCMPTAVVLPKGVKAYEAKINSAGTGLTLTMIATVPQESLEWSDEREGFISVIKDEGVLAAYTPVVLISESPISTAELAVSTKTGVGATDNCLEGNLVTMPQDGASTYYVLNKKDNVAGFYKYKAGSNVIGFKAYYKTNSASSNSNGFAFTLDDDPTALEDAVMEVIKAKASIRDLMGNPVANPIKGQIYIQNGKTFKY